MRNTRKILVSSFIMILSCCLLFAGTTFAWFSDSVSSNNNIITTGNLDVELEYSYDGADWNKVNEETYVFDQKALWEPGYTEYVFLRVSNLGSLALKYTLSLKANDVLGTNRDGEEYKLSDYLTVSALVSDELAEGKLDREDALAILNDAQNEIGFGVVAQSSALLKNEADYVQLVIAMPTSVGNEANPLKGKEARVSFSLNLIATQLNNETDSFGPDYDVNAPWVGGVDTDWYFENPTATTFELNSAEDLAGLAAIVNGTAEAKTRAAVKESFKGKTIVLDKDLDLSNLPWTPIGSNKNPFLGNFDGAGHTVYNLNVENDGWAGFFGHVGLGVGSTIKNLNIENVEISSSRMAGAVVGQIYGDVINCHVKNANILVTPNLVGSSYDNGDKVGGLVGWLGDNGNNRTLSNCSATNVYITGYRDLGGIAGYVASSTTVANNKVNGLVIKGDQTTYHYGNKDFNLGAICGRVNGKITDTENVYDNVDITGFYLKDGVEYYTNLTNPDKPVVLLYDVTEDFVGSELIVPEGVTALRNKNLNGDARIKEVVLPLSVTDFGGSINGAYGASGSFFYKSAVEKITLPEGLTEIPVGAFNQAANLKEVNIPSTVTTIGQAAFGGTGLESLTIPASVTSIGNGAFRDMVNLTTVTIEGKELHIPDYAFRSCKNLTSIYMHVENLTLGTNMIFTYEDNNNDKLADLTIYCFNDTVYNTLASHPQVKCNIVNVNNDESIHCVTNAMELEAAYDNAKDGDKIFIMNDIVISEKWDSRRADGSRVKTELTINGLGHTLKVTGQVHDGGNNHAVFRFEGAAVVENLTFDLSEAANPNNSYRWLRAISSSSDLVVRNCVFIGSDQHSHDNAIVFGDTNAGTNIDAKVEITGCTFVNFRRGISDNESGKREVRSLVIKNCNFETAEVSVSAYENIEFTGNTLVGCRVALLSYINATNVKITCVGNLLDANQFNWIQANPSNVLAQEDIPVYAA